MKKSNILTCVMAIVAIAAIIFGIVTNGQKADLSKQVEDLKANVATLTSSLESAKQEAADAVAAAKAEGEAALAAVKEEAEKAIAAAQEEAAKLVEAAKTSVEEAVENVTEEAAGKTMTHEDFVAAELETEVTVETYVQAKQGWWENNGVGNATLYTQAEDGAYFLYNLPMSQEDYDKLVPGTKIRVTGYKSAWAEEVEIIDATYEILEADPFIAEPEDVTALLGSDELIAHQNELITVKGAVVAAKKDANGNDVAFLYNWDGSGAAGNNNDLYFDLEVNGAVYSFTVESYLCGEDTEVYQAVTKLNIGDKIDVEGFLYWYNGAQPHVIAVKAAE
ncbi:MAG: hypothetical protein IKH57_19805 [Clostridia bacterium]|nr:hypothetical protein [Clostridia bacterium]